MIGSRRRQGVGRYEIISLLLLMVVTAQAASDGDMPSSLSSFVTAHWNISRSDFAALDNGKVVTRILKVGENREVAGAGVVRLNVSADVFLEDMIAGLGVEKDNHVIGIGRFSAPPSLDDLNGLSFEPSELADLKKCRIGKCDVKLPATLIETFQSNVDWKSTNGCKDADTLARRALLNYVTQYLQHGHAALSTYDDRRPSVAIGGELQSLLGEFTYLAEHAPEFYSYVEDFPKHRLDGVQDFIYWSQVRFGYKPVLMITHSSVYSRVVGDISEVFVFSKNLYSSHYFEGALSLTFFVQDLSVNSGSKSYLAYVNRTRTDVLRGAFSGIRRALIAPKVRDALHNVLADRKRKYPGR